MNILEYLGRFHPVLVHLPIGILLSAIFLECLSPFRGFKKVRRSIRVLLLIGFASALFTSATGWLHAMSGDYDPELVASHRALALVVTAFSFLALMLHGRKGKEVKLGYFIVLFSLTILILLTGHSGGSITHGPDFLRPPVAEWWDEEETSEAPLTTNSRFYADAVAPVLQKKCTGCHGATRQKGKLRLDLPEHIMKGGEDGPVIDVKNPEQGDLWRRISLDKTDEDHMPPKEKTPLTERELKLLTFWLQHGADFHATLGSLPGGEAWTDPAGGKPVDEEINEGTEVPVAMPDKTILEKLRAAGITVSFLSAGDGRISLQCINAQPDQLAMVLPLLKGVDEQLVALHMPGQTLSSTSWGFVGKLSHLKRLHMERSNITDAELPLLSGCTSLQYLNLVGTPVTAAGLTSLNLPALKQVFLYQTRVVPAELPQLQSHFSQARIDLGGYTVSTLASDTTELKERYVVPKQ